MVYRRIEGERESTVGSFQYQQVTGLMSWIQVLTKKESED